MLREMMTQSSIETSSEVLKQQLEEEEKKTQSLSIMLQSCIDDNDRVAIERIILYIVIKNSTIITRSHPITF